MKLKVLTFLFVTTTLATAGHAATCEFVPPLTTTSTSNADASFGFIMIPGAQISGEAYKPLAVKIQSVFPGSLWLGLTDFFLADFPNPIEISSAISACMDQASAAGLSTSTVFMGGHSLGGVVLETYIKDHPELTVGIVLFGSYLPGGWVGSDDNIFPVPVLTAMGTLDGAGLSYVTREFRETADIDATMPEMKGRFPVHLVDLVNHAQVASGPMPSIVIERDIDPEIDNDLAHERYADVTASFMVTQQAALFDAAVVDEWQAKLDKNREFTEKFLLPFQQVALLEYSKSEDGKELTPWMETAQEVLLGLTPEEEAAGNVEVTNEVVGFSSLGGVKPSVEAADCAATVQTYSYNSYSFDPLDFGSVISADVIKAKFKLEDVVLEKLCLPERERRQCKDINKAAYDLALSLASSEALDRLYSKGRQLAFVDDSVSPWGPGWEFSFGLQYTQVSPSLTELRSVSLVSEPDFIISSAAGMHYCDLLSPYRALEWIYIKGVVHG